jgi:hypothetical protein
MNICELFETIQVGILPEEIDGEFQLQGKCIVWTYSLNDNSEELPEIDDDEEELGFSFEAKSAEEILQESYEEDLEVLEGFLDEIEETGNWTFSDPETVGNIISFRIF